MAIDRGYNDYSGYKQLTDKEIFLVTRLKSNAKIRVPECRPVMDKAKPEDQILYRYDQECHDDSNIDRTVYVLAACLYQISVQAEQKYAANITPATAQAV